MIKQCKAYVTHAAGNSISSQTWERAKRKSNNVEKQISLEDLTIFTWNSGTRYKIYNGVPDKSKVMGVFESCCEKHGLNCQVLGAGTEKWMNFNKIPLTLDFLEEVKTKYVFAADSTDVVFTSSFKNILKDFKSTNAKLLFNGECIPFRQPYSPLYGPLTEEWEKFENSIATSPFKHLNSGAFVGNTEFVKLTYAAALEFDIDQQILNGRINSEGRLSDQVRIKSIYHKFYPNMMVDYDRVIFNNISGNNVLL